MDATMRKTLVPVTVKSLSEGERLISMVASTETPDRLGDIVRASGWHLDNYQKNPVILWGHDHQLPPVARAVKTVVDGDRLVQDWHFPVEYGKANPLSEIVFRGYAERVLSASSVGFLPLVYTEVRDKKTREELGLGPMGLLIEEAELWEVSAVNVPANPEALRLLEARGIKTAALAEMWAKGSVYEIRSTPAPAGIVITPDPDVDLSFLADKEVTLPTIDPDPKPEPATGNPPEDEATVEVKDISEIVVKSLDRIVKDRLDYWTGKPQGGT
jgi:hypothetical protein